MMMDETRCFVLMMVKYWKLMLNKNGPSGLNVEYFNDIDYDMIIYIYIGPSLAYDDI